jgi:hypothetical protein
MTQYEQGWYHDKVREQAVDIERLLALKTPASRQLLNTTKALLDEANAEIERLTRERDFAADLARGRQAEIERLRAEIELVSK